MTLELLIQGSQSVPFGGVSLLVELHPTHEHHRIAGKMINTKYSSISQMVCFFSCSYDVLYKVFAENRIGIMRPGYGISPRLPVPSHFHALDSLQLQAMHTKQS